MENKIESVVKRMEEEASDYDAFAKYHKPYAHGKYDSRELERRNHCNDMACTLRHYAKQIREVIAVKVEKEGNTHANT